MSFLRRFFPFFVLLGLVFGLTAACGSGESATPDGDKDHQETSDQDLSDQADNPDGDDESPAESSEELEGVAEQEEAPFADGDDDADSPETPDLESPELERENDAEEPFELDLSDADAPAEAESESQPGFACRGFADCADDRICDMSLGRCEQRSSKIFKGLKLYGFHPPEAAMGDVLVVDGNGFNTFSTTLKIGALSYGLGKVQADENRLLVSVQPNSNGPVKVQVGAATAGGSQSFSMTQTGVIACDGATPDATGVAGSTLLDAGPYAAGYLDIDPLSSRIYYPAQCGSLRRPPVPGTYPVVMILHGNGALFLNYEYLAQMLATWGFVSVMVATEHNNEYSAEAVKTIYEMTLRVRARNLYGIHPMLADLDTTEAVAFIGHSRGCARMQNTFTDHPDIAEHVVASIFLGPAEEDPVVPGYFLVMGAAHDQQSYASNYNNSYNRQHAPKWKVWLPGGNHSLFSDHKVYPLMDGTPTISRKEQLSVVLSFALPLLQRAFGLDEPFAAQLDSPPSSTLYTAESEQ